jgi:hypothetical protein
VFISNLGWEFSIMLGALFEASLQANTRTVPRLGKELCRNANIFALGSFVTLQASRVML